MRDWLKKVFHDATVKVVGGLIAAALGALWVAAVTTSGSRVWAWLTTPVSVPRGAVWLVLSTSATLAVVAAWVIRRKLPERRKVIVDVINATGQAPATAPLDSDEENILQALHSRFPKGMTAESICTAVKRTRASTDMLLDQLAVNGLVKFVRTGPYSGKPSYWALTTVGRNYGVKKGYDLLG